MVLLALLLLAGTAPIAIAASGDSSEEGIELMASPDPGIKISNDGIYVTAANVNWSASPFPNGSYEAYCGDRFKTINNNWHSTTYLLLDHPQIKATIGSSLTHKEKQEVIWKIRHGVDYTIPSAFPNAQAFYDSLENATVPTDFFLFEATFTDAKQPIIIKVPQPSFTINKEIWNGVAYVEALDTPVIKGETLQFKVTLTNHSAYTLNPITWGDTHHTPDVPNLSLGAGASIAFEYTYWVPYGYEGDSLINTASASITYAGLTITASDTVTTDLLDPVTDVRGYKHAIGLEDALMSFELGYGRPHAQGWPIELYVLDYENPMPADFSEPDLGNPDFTTITDADGYFSFNGLARNTWYYMREGFRPGYSTHWAQVLPYDMMQYCDPYVPVGFDYTFKILWDGTIEFYRPIYDTGKHKGITDPYFMFKNMEIPHVVVDKTFAPNTLEARKGDTFYVDFYRVYNDYDIRPVDVDERVNEDPVPIKGGKNRIFADLYSFYDYYRYGPHVMPSLDEMPYFFRLADGVTIDFLLPFGEYRIEEVWPSGQGSWRAPEYLPNDTFVFGWMRYLIKGQEERQTNVFNPYVNIVNYYPIPTPDPGPDPTPDPIPDPDPVGPFGTVVVTYVDTEGITLSPSFSFTGTVGTNYGTSPRTIAGYTLTESPANASGTFTAGTITVIYVYTDGSEIAIEAEEIPLGPGEPEPEPEIIPEEPQVTPEVPEDIVLIEEEVPLGDGLPQTGQTSAWLYLLLSAWCVALGLAMKRLMA